MLKSKKSALSLAMLTIFVVGTCLAFGVVGAVKASRSQSGITVTDYYIPAGSSPWGTTFDKSGRVWVAIPGCDPSPMCNNSTPPGKIAVFNPSHNSWTNTYTFPAGFGQALFLAFDQQGRLWFPMPMSNSLGMFNPATNTFQQWTVPTANAGPWGIAIDSHGRVWFTEHYVNKIGMFDPGSQSFKEVATPSSSSQPYGITVDSSDNIWFTENNSSVALIAEYTNQSSLQEYKIRNSIVSGLTPHLIAVDPGGNIWWTEGFVGAIGTLNVALAQPGTNQGVTEYTYQRLCTSCSAHTSGISVDSNGLVWFDDSLQNSYGSFPMSGSGSFNMYTTPTANGHPHDGMNVDGQNTVWFDEEFANKVARVIVSSPTPTPTPSPTSSPTSSPTPSPTSSPTPSPTSTPTPSPTPSPTPGPTGLLGQDTFQRTNQSLWGKSSGGDSWGGDANTMSAFSISGTSGQLAGNGTSYSAVLGNATTNGEVLFSGSISSFSNANIGGVLRWTDGNNWYKAYIDGTNLVIQRKVSGTTTILAQVPFAATAGTSYTLRFRVVGTTLLAKVWTSSSAEPSAWMGTASDSALTVGYCGLRMLVQGGAVARFTAFSASSL